MEISKEQELKELKRLLYTNNITQYGKRKLINYYEQQIKTQQEEIEKKDKIINEMAKYIEKLTVDLKIPIGENMIWNIEDIKQYFERKIENEC